jgi:lipopolysaccharide transport system ATP-binding protein
MSDIVLKAENISKQYRLGQLGTGTIAHDLNRWWASVRGKEDPYQKIGDVNDRAKAGGSDYVWSLKDINFEVKRGEVLGIIGKNGAGKSTLLKILSQVTTPTTGEVKIKGRIAALLEVGTGFHPDLSGRENIFLNGAILGMTKVEIKSKLDEIVDFSGVAKYLDTPVKRYSSGLTVRDLEFQKKCMGKMKDVSGQGRTVLFVSHNMGAIKAICNKTMLLKNGGISERGDTVDVIGKYFAEDDQMLQGGIIPRNYKRFYNNGDAFFTKAMTADQQHQDKSRFYFREPLNMKLEIEVVRKLKNVILALSIINDEQEKVSYYEYPEHSTDLLEFEPGKYTLNLSFADNFLPGKYFLRPALFYSDGNTIDYIERVSEFEVSNDSAQGEHYYKWNEKHGNSFMSLKTINILKQ